MLASIALTLMLPLASCSGHSGSEATDSAAESAAPAASVSEESIDEIYTRISDMVNRGDLSEDEVDGAIELYGKFWKAYTPAAAEMMKNGSKLVDVYVEQDNLYPQVTMLINKRIYPATFKSKDRKAQEDRLDDIKKEFKAAIGAPDK